MFEAIAITHDGPQLSGHLYLPDATPHARSGYPAVVAGSGFGGVKEMLLPEFARALAQAGIATLLVDFAGFGMSQTAPGQVRQHIDPRAQIQDLRRGLDFLARDRRIDPSKLGVWGPSMCGAHALVVAGSDPRVRAAVSIIPFIKAPVTPPNLRVGLALGAHALRTLLRMSPNLIAAAGEPGQRAVMTNDGALAWIEDVSRDAASFRNEVTVASLLRVATYRPMQWLGPAGIQVPLRTILAADDTLTPAKNARLALRGTPEHDVVEFPGTHFELFGEHRQKTIDLTVEWFTRHLARTEIRPPEASATRRADP